MDRLGIINKALIKLGQQPVKSLNDPDNKNKILILNELYESVRDTIQSSYRWTFCTTRFLLIRDTDNPPAFGWNSFFPFPDDFLRLISIEENKFNHEIENNGILCNAKEPENDTEVSIKIKYIKIVEDEKKFSPAFCNAFATQLAREGCTNITQNEKLANKLTSEFFENISTAKKVDAIQRPPIRQNPSQYEEGFIA